MTEVVEKVLLALKGNSMSLLSMYQVLFVFNLLSQKKTDNKYCYIFNFGYYIPKKTNFILKDTDKKIEAITNLEDELLEETPLEVSKLQQKNLILID